METVPDSVQSVQPLVHSEEATQQQLPTTSVPMGGEEQPVIATCEFFHCVPLNYSIVAQVSAVTITNLTSEESESLKNDIHCDATKVVETPRVGLLFFTSAESPQTGVSLVATSQYGRLMTFPFLIDTGSQINVINHENVTEMLGKVNWEIYPPQLTFQPVDSSPTRPLATLPRGVLDLIVAYGTNTQLVVKTEWTVLSSGDKKNTPLIGNGVYCALNAQCNSGNNATLLPKLIYHLPDGSQGSISLQYTDTPYRTKDVSLLPSSSNSQGDCVVIK